MAGGKAQSDPRSAGEPPLKRRILPWLFAMLWLALAGMPMAANAQDASPLPSEPTIDLPVGQGRIVRFNEPVESVLIADTTIADLQVVSPDIVYVFGLKPGSTNLIAVTADQRIEATAHFRVSADGRAAGDARNRLQPTSSIDLTIFGDRMVAVGQARNVDEAIDVDEVARSFSPGQPPINATTMQGGQQVNIRVRFAEVSRKELQSYGVDWSVGYKSGGFEFSLMQNNGVPSSKDGGLGAVLGQATGFNFEVFIEALQRNGLVKILAEPNLTAVTGQTASFLAGGEIPIPVPQGSDTVTVQYKSFGVSLTFTPTLIGRNRIGLHVKPEVSSISTSGSAIGANGFNLPSFVVRKADTIVEVASGQTFAIAGLFQQTFTRDLEKFPVLGDVPVLGALFQSQRFQKEETELVILITPYLVEPVSDTLAAPSDRPAGKGTRRHSKNSSAMGLIIK
ncbi:type II and III secretion system protein RhcC2 [Nitratireductor pacificus pht-3B]|uniref:Type II and III secretion system protein RhcC2 n=1 Tax=Nitratireductor pacificus pht-3B TaxID=391937 RepID=K2LJ09_9HYPH|nr:type II and III secretion system protein RhcC2 [Nitratireductor pacificus pht-3B]